MSHLNILGAAKAGSPGYTIQVWSHRMPSGRGIEYDPEVDRFVGRCLQLKREKASRAATRRAFNPSSQICTSECRKCFSL